MDRSGNIYEVEEMRRRLLDEGVPEEADLERRFAEDEARLDGYLKGRSEQGQIEAEKRFREQLRAPFKKSC